MAVNRDDFLSGLAHLIPVIEDRLHQAKHFCAEGSLDDFVEKKIGCLYGIAQAYNKCFLRCEVKDKAALERLAQSNFRHGDVRDAMHELDDAERELDRFLLDLDRKLDISKSATLTTGQLAPLDIPLIDARSNEPTSLRQYLGQENMSIVDSHHGRVLMVSFGERKGALRWLEEMNCNYTMLLDFERNLYKAFGLKRSVYKVWCASTMAFYGEQMAAGRTIPKPYEDVHDDPHQMGGNFIVDGSTGRMVLLYRSKTAPDRPTVPQLLQILQNIGQSVSSVSVTFNGCEYFSPGRDVSLSQGMRTNDSCRPDTNHAQSS